MRVTGQMMHNRVLSLIQRGSRDLFDAQQKVATQKRINSMSDDPVGAGRVLNLRSLLAQNAQFQRNLSGATSWANLYDSTMDTVIENITRGKELILSQANDIAASPQTREAARVEMVSLLGGLLTSANARIGSQFIFGGYHTDTAPFLDAFSTTTAAAGNTGGAAVASERIFDYVQLANEDYEIRFHESAGAVTYDIYNTTRGTYVSTDNAWTSGQEIRFSGIAVTIESASGDPAEGDAFQVASTAAGTYIGDNGELRLELEKDKMLKINMTGDAVFQGAGLSGGINLFDLFNSAICALRETDPAARNAAFQTLIDDFDTALNQVANFQATAGSKQSQYDDISQRLASFDLSMTAIKSEIEDMDIAEALTTLTQRETAYEASLNAAARVVQPSLLHYLR